MSEFQDAVNRFFHEFDLIRRQADLTFLSEILAAFAHFPYENLTKIIRLHSSPSPRERLRMPDEIMADYRRYKTGGTCFSLSFFLDAILKSAGFTSYIAMADMHIGRNVHCVVIALLGTEKYICDPGYLIHLPLRLPREQGWIFETDTAWLEIVPEAAIPGNYTIWTMTNQARKYRYTLRDEPTERAAFFDYWQASFELASMHSLIVTTVRAGEQFYLKNRSIRIANRVGKKNQKIKQDLENTIAGVFGIDPRITEEARAALIEYFAGIGRLSRLRTPDSR
jgi:arylamine N-acetyltransferase